MKPTMSGRPTQEQVAAALRWLECDDPEPGDNVDELVVSSAKWICAEVRALREELEVERLRLAACGVAANGGGEEHFAAMMPEYASDALRATLGLTATIARVEALLDREAAAFVSRVDIDLVRVALRGEP